MGQTWLKSVFESTETLQVTTIWDAIPQFSLQSVQFQLEVGSEVKVHLRGCSIKLGHTHSQRDALAHTQQPRYFKTIQHNSHFWIKYFGEILPCPQRMVVELRLTNPLLEFTIGGVLELCVSRSESYIYIYIYRRQKLQKPVT